MKIEIELNQDTINKISMVTKTPLPEFINICVNYVLKECYGIKEESKKID